MTHPTARQAKPSAGGQGTAPRPRSFLVGTQGVIQGNDYDQTYNTTNTQAAIPWALQATGWLRGLFLTVSGSGLTAGTKVADGPYNLFANIQLDDVNNEAIFGPFDGYSAMLTNKYGGYFFEGDPSTQHNFVYDGTASTQNFLYTLWIPLEIVSRDPIGPVASVNNTASLTLRMMLNPTTTVFTSPTGTLMVRIRGTQDFYWEPRRADPTGAPIAKEPPASGTTQYWTQGSYAISGAGTINAPLQTGLGYPFRIYIFKLRDATGSRALGETNFPQTLIGLKFEANMIVSNFEKALWRHLISLWYLQRNPAFDARAAGAESSAENGVFVLPFNTDFAWRKPGSETRRGYLVTSPGSNFIFNGNMGGAGTLYSIVNYIAPGGGAQFRQNTAGLTGGQ